MELEGLNKDRLPHDCMDAGGRVTQEQLPKDAAAEQPWMASFACLDLNLPVAWPKQASYLKRNVSLLIRGMS